MTGGIYTKPEVGKKYVRKSACEVQVEVLLITDNNIFVRYGDGHEDIIERINFHKSWEEIPKKQIFYVYQFNSPGVARNGCLHISEHTLMNTQLYKFIAAINLQTVNGELKVGL